MTSQVYRYRSDLAAYMQAAGRYGTTPDTEAMWLDLNRRWRWLPLPERLRIRWILCKMHLAIRWVLLKRRLQGGKP